MIVSIPAKYLETRYKNEENKYFIGVFTTLKKNIPQEYISSSDRRRKISFSVKGYDIPDIKKFDILLTGEFRQEQQYGLTMYVQSAVITEPSDIEGIQFFLEEFISGVGAKTAKALTDKFGEKTLEVIENEPERLYDVPRLRKATVDKIIDSYRFSKQNAEIVKLLAPFNLSSNTIMKIKSHFEGDRRTKVTAVEIIKENPFVLSKIKGISFETLDNLTTRFGCNPLEPERIECCILNELEKAQTDGHLYLEQHELLNRAVTTLNIGYAPNTVTPQDVAICMCEMAKKQTLLGDNGNAYTPSNYTYETISANRIGQYISTKIEKVDISDILPTVEKKLGISLAEKQADAVEMAVNSLVSIVVGSAGTGKTTVLKAILSTLLKLGYEKDDIALAAPTGRAAQRMSEVTGFEAQTIHSLLGIRGEGDEPTENLKQKYLIIDEASMIDMFICYKIFTSISPDTTRVLFLGDTGQLPSVGAGNVLHELVSMQNLFSDSIPITELNVIFRQASDNIIIKNSHNIRYGRERVDFNDDFCYFPEYNQEAAAKLITDLFVNEASALGLDNVICISPLRDKGFCSAHELNNSIQARINPESPAKAQCKVKGTIFRVLDRVIQCQNIEVKTIYGNTVYISNGGIGKILSIKKEDSDYIFQIDFGEKRIVEFNRDNMLSVKLAYALTVHKSQGAEFESVIMPLFRYFGVAMNYRNMFYTAVTRAKKKFQIVGESECIYMCIRNNKITHRNTKLSFRIGQKMLSELF